MTKIMKKFNIPILFIIYKRKDVAVRVVDAIAKVKPEKLYISQDGPKNKNQAKDIKETLEAVISKIYWKCELVVWTHDKNLGIKKHIPDAFEKFFKKEDVGIYLEDDTLPCEEFFYFEEELLNKYKNDKKIFSINGTNFYPEKTKKGSSYYLSKLGDIWGFGLWKRSWELYNSEMIDFDEVSKRSEYNKYFFNNKYRYYLETFWKAIKVGKVDSWAMQLIYSAVKNNMYFISPSVNMVNNIGKGRSASNVSIQEYYQEYGNPFPLKHPKSLEYSRKNDINYFRSMLKGGWIRLFAIRTHLFLPTSIKKIVNKIINNI